MGVILIGMVFFEIGVFHLLCVWVGSVSKKFFHDFMIGIEMEFFGLAGDVDIHVEVIVDSWVFFFFLHRVNIFVDAAPASCTFAIVF